jgi:hypothetical protein
MQALLFVALAAISTELGSVSHAAGIQPLPQLAFVLQTSAIGTAVGSAVAARAKRRNPDADTWAITTAWATLGLVVGVGFMIASILV